MKRLALLAVVVLALVLAGIGNSASFDDSSPCPVQGTLFVCPPATVGLPYSLQLTGRNGCDLYWFEILGGALPPGLSMSRSGLVSGTATEAAVTTPWLQIHDLLPSEGGYDWCGGDNISQRQFEFSAFGTVPIPVPLPIPKRWYWHLTGGTGQLLHSERAITYADGSNGLGKMLTWEQNHRDVLRATAPVQLAHVLR